MRPPNDQNFPTRRWKLYHLQNHLEFGMNYLMHNLKSAIGTTDIVSLDFNPGAARYNDAGKVR